MIYSWNILPDISHSSFIHFSTDNMITTLFYITFKYFIIKYSFLKIIQLQSLNLMFQLSNSYLKQKKFKKNIKHHTICYTAGIPYLLQKNNLYNHTFNIFSVRLSAGSNNFLIHGTLRKKFISKIDLSKFYLSINIECWSFQS